MFSERVGINLHGITEAGEVLEAVVEIEVAVDLSEIVEALAAEVAAEMTETVVSEEAVEEVEEALETEASEEIVEGLEIAKKIPNGVQETETRTTDLQDVILIDNPHLLPVADDRKTAEIGAETVEDLAMIAIEVDREIVIAAAIDHVMIGVDLVIKIEVDHLVGIAKEKVVGEMRLNLKINQKKQLPWLKESKKLLKKQRLPLPPQGVKTKNFVKTQEISPRMTRFLGTHLLLQTNNKSPTTTTNHLTKKMLILIILKQNKPPTPPRKI